MNDAPIRRALATDGATCAAIINHWIDTTVWMPRLVPEEVIVDALTKGFTMREAYVIGEPVTGYLSLETEISHILGFYVSQTGQGLGKALLDQVKQGWTFLKLNTHHENQRAHAFYRCEGFVQIGEPWLGDDGIDEITMEWRA
jgi:putative acetyltransferase